MLAYRESASVLLNKYYEIGDIANKMSGNPSPGEVARNGILLQQKSVFFDSLSNVMTKLGNQIDGLQKML